MKEQIIKIYFNGWEERMVQFSTLTSNIGEVINGLYINFDGKNGSPLRTVVQDAEGDSPGKQFIFNLNNVGLIEITER